MIKIKKLKKNNIYEFSKFSMQSASQMKKLAPNITPIRVKIKKMYLEHISIDKPKEKWSEQIPYNKIMSPIQTKFTDGSTLKIYNKIVEHTSILLPYNDSHKILYTFTSWGLNKINFQSIKNLPEEEGIFSKTFFPVKYVDRGEIIHNDDFENYFLINDNPLELYTIPYNKEAGDKSLNNMVKIAIHAIMVSTNDEKFKPLHMQTQFRNIANECNIINLGIKNQDITDIKKIELKTDKHHIQPKLQDLEKAWNLYNSNKMEEYKEELTNLAKDTINTAIIKDKAIEGLTKKILDVFK